MPTRLYKMKKYFKISVLFLAIISIVGCENSSKPKQQTINIYNDNAIYRDGDIEISFEELKEHEYGGNIEASFSLFLLNKNPTAHNYEISAPKIIRESNNAEYKIRSMSFLMDPSTFELPCDIKKTLYFECTIPLSIKEEKYYFSFKGDGKDYRYYFYDMPDELRGEATLHYVVDGTKEKTVKVLDGKKLSKYDWVSDDYVYGCREWYQDPELTTRFEDVPVYGEMTIYGSSSIILNGYSGGYNSNFFVTGYYFIPSTGEIVIPKTIKEWTIYSIVANAFYGCTELKDVYIPKTVQIQRNSFNTLEPLKNVFFEGTEEEWNTVNQEVFPESTNIVFNTYK